jgi:hypothetical protein
MFERYTEQARRVIFFGRFEAGHRGSPYIEVEHLLLASLGEDRLLLSLLPEGATEAIRQRIEAVAPHSESPANPHGDMPLSHDAKQSLSLAAEEAEGLGSRKIEASHLLLGMLHLKDGIAADFLQPYGIDLHSYRQAHRPPQRYPASPVLAGRIASIEALLARAVDLHRIPPAAVGQPLKRKSWSRQEALGHLIDWATAHHQWFARALAEPKLVAAGYPDDNWVALQRYSEMPWLHLVDLWAALNRLLVHVLRQVPDGKLNLSCRIGVAEPIALERLAENYLAHLEDILGQILTRAQAG